MSRPAATHGSAGTVAAALTRKLTGRDPLAFIATTVQSPLLTGQISTWVPVPAACADHIPA